jgi:hypothetical protein
LAPSQRDPGEQRRQVLLSAVVQVTLEPAPRGLLGFQDALTGCVDLDQLFVELISEPALLSANAIWRASVSSFTLECGSTRPPPEGPQAMRPRSS